MPGAIGPGLFHVRRLSGAAGRLGRRTVSASGNSADHHRGRRLAGGRASVGPGVIVGHGTILALGSAAVSDLAADQIHQNSAASAAE